MTTQRPARNRVSPLGEIIAVSGRGAWMGNRGRLHEDGPPCTRDVVRNHQHKTWITCVLSFRGRRVPQWEPNRYTPLFFLDEAVALAAGHRPCAECRHSAYIAYRTLWAETHCGARTYAKDMDTQLHLERTGRAEHRAPWASLPDGVFVATDSRTRRRRRRPPCGLGPTSTTTIGTRCSAPLLAPRRCLPHRPPWRSCAPATPCRSMIRRGSRQN